MNPQNINSSSLTKLTKQEKFPVELTKLTTNQQGETSGEAQHLENVSPENAVSVVSLVSDYYKNLISYEELSNEQKLPFILYLEPGQDISLISEKLSISKDTALTYLSSSRSKERRNGQISYRKDTSGLYYLTDSYKKQFEKEILSIIEREKHAEMLKNRGLEVEQRVKAHLHYEFKNKKLIKKFGSRITLNYSELVSNLDISKLLEDEPATFLQIVEKWVKEFFEVPSFEIINFSERDLIKIEEIRTKHLDGLHRLRGVIVGASEIRPQCVLARFECPNCGAILSVLQIDKKFREPSICTCGWKSSFKLLSKEMVDTLKIILQDIDEPTADPKKLDVYFKGQILDKDNLKTFVPGSEIDLIGILKEVPVPMQNNQISVRFDLALESYGALAVSSAYDPKNFSDLEVLSIKQCCNEIESNGLDNLISSFAPHVEGHEILKEALILTQAQPKNDTRDPQAMRSKSNILIVGDPGIAKSQLCGFITKINPESKMGSCTGASTVGIVASVEKDSSGQWYVRPGLSAMAKDTCILEELNLLPEEEAPKLQEVMNDKRATINKASIRQIIPISAGFIFNANPSNGRFTNNGIPLHMQFKIFSPIKDRLDLIFYIQDLPDTEKDKKVSQAVLNRKTTNKPRNYDITFLSKFFAYVRSLQEPSIPKELHDTIVQNYANIRKQNINVSPRYNEVVIRLSKAYSRLRGDSFCNSKDIQRAHNIILQSLGIFGGLFNAF